LSFAGRDLLSWPASGALPLFPLSLFATAYLVYVELSTATLSVDGKVVATQTMERTIPLILPWDETFDIGSDTGTPVDDQDYQVPFAFTGKIDKLTFSIGPPTLTDEDKRKLMEADRAMQDAN
jgi:arylsulfatase